MKVSTLMKILLGILIVTSIAFASEMSVCGTEELLPIGFTEEELTRINEIGSYQEATSPPPSGVRNPGEFEPASGIMVRWPLGVPYDFLVDVSENSELWVICSSSDQASATSALTSAGVNMSNTDFITAGTNSIWVRDYGPWFIVLSDGTQGIFDYDYNRPRPLDDIIPQVIGTEWGIPVYISDLIHTGGNYMSSGLGQGMSTDLVYVEDPHSDEWVDDQMEEYLGVAPYITFDDPQASYIDHIDCWSKILSPDRIMVLQVPPSHQDYVTLEAAADLIAASDSPYGNKWNVYRVYSTGTEGYVNGLLHNDTYYMPVWNTGNDSPAAIAFEEALPGYTIKPFYYSGFLNTDALHCRTRNVMDNQMLQVLHTPVDTIQGGYPVVINAFIQPNPANTISSAKVFYRIDSGSFTEISMTDLGSNNYSAVIPTAANASIIDYYIKVEDSSSRVSAHPQFAPDTWFNTYTVSSSGVSETELSIVKPVMMTVNPFSSSLAFTGQPGTAFSVYDSAGRVVFEAAADENGIMEWVPNQTTANGVFFAKFVFEGNQATSRAVLLR